MNEAEVDAALCLNSPALVAEIHDTIKKNVENYGQKLARLDTKATSLLGAIALSLTVAFTYGGSMLVAQKDNLKPLGDGRLSFALVFYGLAILSGVGAGACAAFALLVRDHAEMAERVVFNAKELREADAAADDATGQAKGLASYRRGVTIHLWKIVRQREDKCLAKGRYISWGQRLFFCFLLCLLVVGIEIVTRLL